MNQLRSELPPLPDRIRRLPIDKRGYPIPWFVATVNGEPEFRVADGEKMTRAVRERLCWVCGDKLGRHLAFVVGPMCVVNRISAEPPSHRECAEFSLRACPFLSKPHMERREGGVPEEADSAGVMIRRNPGVMVLWMTHDYQLTDDGEEGVLFQLGEPAEVVPWREGRLATAEEVFVAFESGLPILEDMAKQEGQAALARLQEMVLTARRLLGLAEPRPPYLAAPVREGGFP